MVEKNILEQITEKGEKLIEKLTITIKRNDIKREINNALDESIQTCCDVLKALKDRDLKVITNEFRDKKLEELDSSHEKVKKLINELVKLNGNAPKCY